MGRLSRLCPIFVSLPSHSPGEAALSQQVHRPQALVTATTTEHKLEATAALQTH